MIKLLHDLKRQRKLLFHMACRPSSTCRQTTRCRPSCRQRLRKQQSFERGASRLASRPSPATSRVLSRCFTSRSSPLNTLIHLYYLHSLPTHNITRQPVVCILTSLTTGCLRPPRIHSPSPPAPSKAPPPLAAAPLCSFLCRHHTAFPPPSRAAAPPRPRCSFSRKPSSVAAAAQGKKTPAPPQSRCCSNRARRTWVGSAY